jgi:hypothetical protein
MTNPSMAPIGHLLKASELQYARAARSYHTIASAAAVVASNAVAGRVDFAALHELAQLQMAVWQRALSTGDAWRKNWEGWWGYASGTQGANTTAKLAERQANIVAQMTQILGGQFTDLIGLQENVEVNYAFWIDQKLRCEFPEPEAPTANPR